MLILQELGHKLHGWHNIWAFNKTWGKTSGWRAEKWKIDLLRGPTMLQRRFSAKPVRVLLLPWKSRGWGAGSVCVWWGVWSESKREHRRAKLKQKRGRRATDLPRQQHVIWKRGLISKVKSFLQHLGGLHRLLFSYSITPELSLISVLWDMRAFAGKFMIVFTARQNAESQSAAPTSATTPTHTPTHTSSESLHQMYLYGRV